MIKIGKRTYKGSNYDDSPTPQGFTKIVVMIKTDLSQNEYGSLSPYFIKDENGNLIENRWQFSKVYQTVPAIKMPYSTNNPKIVWENPKETHIDQDGNLTPEFFEWRKKGMKNKEPVRFPVGMSLAARSSCQFALDDKLDGSVDTENHLDYVQSRKQIYGKYYCSNVKKHPHFQILKEMLENGVNLMIIEVDGPHQESMNYYRNTYNVNNDFIVNGTIVCNIPNMRLLINDTKHAFGHGYCLGMELLGITADVCQN